MADLKFASEWSADELCATSPAATCKPCVSKHDLGHEIGRTRMATHRSANKDIQHAVDNGPTEVENMTIRVWRNVTFLSQVAESVYAFRIHCSLIPAGCSAFGHFSGDVQLSHSTLWRKEK